MGSESFGPAPRQSEQSTLTRLIWALGLVALTARGADLPEGFVYLADVAPGIRQEVRYYSKDNFVGRRIDGYQRPVVIVTAAAAAALREVQAELQPFGLGLKIFDAYRPQRAVDVFVAWAENPARNEMKARYYPDVAKVDLLPGGYITARSGHTRGSTVDLTIVELNGAGAELDMGTGWDLFSPLSWPDSAAIPFPQRAHRLLLRSLMTRYGFAPLREEWWHFTLQPEPFPDTYFDFPVR